MTTTTAQKLTKSKSLKTPFDARPVAAIENDELVNGLHADIDALDMLRAGVCGVCALVNSAEHVESAERIDWSAAAYLADRVLAQCHTVVERMLDRLRADLAVAEDEQRFWQARS